MKKLPILSTKIEWRTWWHTVSLDSRFHRTADSNQPLELAHQWFGNLVTMDWWNELWLNEGFATWVGWLAIDHFHPDHEVWTQFVAGSYYSEPRPLYHCSL